MKKMKILMLFSTFFMAGCSLFPKNEDRGKYLLNPEKAVIHNASGASGSYDFGGVNYDTESMTFNFSQSDFIRSFSFRTYTTGVYEFSSQQDTSGIEIEVHTGSLVSDMFKTLPFSIELDANYSYTVEIKCMKTEQFDKDIVVEIKKPASSTGKKDISNYSSFTDISSIQGEVLTYYFTAKSSGQYILYCSNVKEMELFRVIPGEQNRSLTSNYLNTLTYSLTSGNEYMYKITTSESKAPGKINFTFTQPAGTITITTEDLLKGPNYVVFPAPSRNATQLVVIKPTEDTTLFFGHGQYYGNEVECENHTTTFTPYTKEGGATFESKTYLGMLGPCTNLEGGKTYTIQIKIDSTIEEWSKDAVVFFALEQFVNPKYLETYRSYTVVS